MSTVASEPSPQHLRALERANAVRLARANLKRKIGDGELSAADVFADCPWEALSMSVADVLMSQRRWGSHRCRKLLFGLRISETKTVGALTDRQRGELARRLQGGTEHSAAAPAAPAPAPVAVPA
jgi:hypothetical protein